MAVPRNPKNLRNPRKNPKNPRRNPKEIEVY